MKFAWHRRIPRFRKVLTSFAILASSGFVAGSAYAGFISTPDLDPIFSQSVFGATPIAVHWLAPTSIVDASLASIDSGDEFIRLAGDSPDALPVVNAFFVDSINFCGGPASNIIGCSFQSSNVIAIDSSFAAGASGYIAIAHELGHSLGLQHVDGTGNLMNPYLNSTLLTSTQAATVLGATYLVQSNPAGGRFIDIRPIAVLASAVPEPAAYAMLLAGLMIVATVARRTATRTPADPRAA